MKIDYRMDKVSWLLLAIILAVMMYFIASGATSVLSGTDYFQILLFGLLTTIALLALSSIPVLIYCYFKNVIPDIDYSIRAAFIFTIVGVISELIF